MPGAVVASRQLRGRAAVAPVVILVANLVDQLLGLLLGLAGNLFDLVLGVLERFLGLVQKSTHDGVPCHWSTGVQFLPQCRTTVYVRTRPRLVGRPARCDRPGRRPPPGRTRTTPRRRTRRA